MINKRESTHFAVVAGTIIGSIPVVAGIVRDQDNAKYKMRNN